MNKIILFFAVIGLFGYGSASPARADEWLEESRTAMRYLYDIDPHHDVDWAYHHLDYEYSLRDPDPDFARNILRRRCLLYSAEKNGQLIERFEHSDLEAPELLNMLKDSCAWAEEEKKKTAEELYQRSKTVAADIRQEEYKKRFEMLYLILASEKGHKKACKEVKDRLPPLEEVLKNDQP
ncbi:MAG: hypothetical protein K9G62_08765 [Alphaproteobacteria bacterium]|nr:hypothetical protein [Alphaproteobacteria bacterium]